MKTEYLKLSEEKLIDFYTKATKSEVFCDFIDQNIDKTVCFCKVFKMIQELFNQ